MTAIPPEMAKSQTLEILFGGRSYIIVSAGQMDYVKSQKRELILCDAFYKKETLTEEQVEKAVNDYVVNECEYATLDYVLGLMTPQQRQDWKNNYRFAGISRKK